MAMGSRMLDPSLVRVGDVDRDECVDRLQSHFVAGRLEQEEFEDRVAKALVARTAGELDVLDADCRPTPRRASGSLVTRVGVCVAGLAAIVALAGIAAAADRNDVPPSTCVATGLSVPEGTFCPDVTRQQARLMQDATKAEAAADQVSALDNSSHDARLHTLAEEAEAAVDRAQQAATDAQLIIAAAPDGKVGAHGLDAAAKKARSAAADAARAAVKANAIVHHAS